jgi:hypothetical protein
MLTLVFSTLIVLMILFYLTFFCLYFNFVYYKNQKNISIKILIQLFLTL